MRYHVFKALSQCIEDDGHRVCSVGYAQRIVTALQGFYLKEVRIDGDYLHTQDPARTTIVPQVFFTHQAQRFDRSLIDGQETAAEDLRAFGENTMNQAREAYGADAPQLAQVVNMLEEYIRIAHDLDVNFSRL